MTIAIIEDRGRKGGFAKMRKVEKVSSDNIRPIAAEEFAEGTVAKIDGFHAYGVAFRCYFSDSMDRNGKGELGYPGSHRGPWCFSLLTCVSKDSVEA